MGRGREVNVISAPRKTGGLKSRGAVQTSGPSWERKNRKGWRPASYLAHEQVTLRGAAGGGVLSSCDITCHGGVAGVAWLQIWGTGCRRGTGLNGANSNGASLSAFGRNPRSANEEQENDAERSSGNEGYHLSAALRSWADCSPHEVGSTRSPKDQSLGLEVERRDSHPGSSEPGVCALLLLGGFHRGSRIPRGPVPAHQTLSLTVPTCKVPAKPPLGGEQDSHGQAPGG